MKRQPVVIAFLGGWIGWLAPGAADESSRPANETATAAARWNVELLTLGGRQFWTDEFVYLDWRIQRQVLSGHCRLLDDKNVRRAWGTFEQCQGEFTRLKQELSLPRLRPRAVLVLHGLVRSRESMDGLCAFLAEPEEYSVLNVSYASTRGELADHSAALAHVVEGLEGVDEVHFVAHSLGNLVVRHYLHDRSNGTHQQRTVPRIGRIVMIAPPNNGAELASRFRDNPIFQAVWGESGRELGKDWANLVKRLATPTGEFGVIAGGRNNPQGRNPLLPGDDDFVVAVEETRLPGARDFAVVPALHGTIMNDRQVQEFALQFLRHGFFVSDEARQPIPPNNVGSVP